MVPSPRRLPHTISPLEEAGFELLVPLACGTSDNACPSVVRLRAQFVIRDQQFESRLLQERVHRELDRNDLLAGRAIKDAPLALGEDALNQRQLRSRTGITVSL
jgi:hypothetical protein